MKCASQPATTGMPMKLESILGISISGIPIIGATKVSTVMATVAIMPARSVFVRLCSCMMTLPLLMMNDELRMLAQPAELTMKIALRKFTVECEFSINERCRQDCYPARLKLLPVLVAMKDLLGQQQF